MNHDEILTALERLGQLRQQGILDDDEFAREKKRLLALLQEAPTHQPSSPDPASPPSATPPTAASPSTAPPTTSPAPATPSTPPVSSAPELAAVDIFATGGGLPPEVANTPAATSPATPSPLPSGPAPSPASGAAASLSAAPTSSAAGSPPPGSSSPAEAGFDFFATGGGVAPEPPATPTTPAQPAPLAEATALLAGRYQVERELGRGGMGRVLRAIDLQTQRPVALKTLHQTRSPDELRQQFLQELTLLERLDHPHIIRFQSLERDPQEGFFFTMEYVQGRDLASLLTEARQRGERTPLPLERTLSLLEQITDALDHAHEQGIVHLDLKPANVLLDDHDQVKLIDFGIARLRSAAAGTQARGTVYYMAPEQLSGEGPLTAAADLYALGVLAYQLLTGELFQGGMPGPSQLNTQLPHTIDLVHEKALSWKPQERYPSASKWFQAFRRALKERPRPSSRQPSQQASPTAGSPPSQRPHQAPQVTAPADSLLTPTLWKEVQQRAAPKRPSWLDPPLAPEEPLLLAPHQLDAPLLGDLPLPPLPDSYLLLARDHTPLLELCPVPAGTFLMGARKNDRPARRNEKPQVQVSLSGYWIARVPLTNRIWKKFLDESGYEPEGPDKHPDYLEQWKRFGTPNEDPHGPVVTVSLAHAWAFCDFYGLTLPSEAQWERAVRGTDDRPYPWGDQPASPQPGQRNTLAHVGATNHSTTPVHQHPDGASPAGLLDGVGNVRQWTADAFDPNWLKHLSGKDPLNPGLDRTQFHTLRGSSSTISPTAARTTRRDNAPPDSCLPDLGFRPSLDLQL